MFAPKASVTAAARLLLREPRLVAVAESRKRTPLPRNSATPSRTSPMNRFGPVMLFSFAFEQSPDERARSSTLQEKAFCCQRLWAATFPESAAEVPVATMLSLFGNIVV